MATAPVSRRLNLTRDQLAEFLSDQQQIRQFEILFSNVNLMPVENGGTGLSTIPTNGQLLIGNGTGYSLNTLGVGAGITVTNGIGTISVANAGVLSNIAGTGISVSSATGNVTVANTGVLSFSGGTTGLTPATATTGVVTLAGILAIANGGTGASTLAGASIATYTGTETLTNKRIDPRVISAASASSLTPSIATADVYAYTALAAGLTINAPTGTPVDGDKLMFRLLDNGTSRALTWNATYTVIGVTLPTATTISKTTYVGCIYNANNTRWDVIAVTTQA